MANGKKGNGQPNHAGKKAGSLIDTPVEASQSKKQKKVKKQSRGK